MGIFDRFSTLLRSNINDLISRAEDPEKMLNQILEDRRVQLVVNRLALALGDDEAAGAEDREVARDGGPGGLELVGDLARSARTGAEQIEDLSPRFVRERAKDRVRGPSLFFHD